MSVRNLSPIEQITRCTCAVPEACVCWICDTCHAHGFGLHPCPSTPVEKELAELRAALQEALDEWDHWTDTYARDMGWGPGPHPKDPRSIALREKLLLKPEEN